MDDARLACLLDQAERLCAGRGARLTPQRREVLELICASDRPLSAYEILDLMRTPTRNPAPPTVYRALDFLLEQGLVHRIESLHAFVGCNHPEHPHPSQFLICTDCGAVHELENERIAEVLHSAELSARFTTERPVVELLGTCARCREKRETPRNK